ncbi:MAG: aconitate hydratase, partial [Bacteroidaceae bacterium]|nr:aconitate hydratase [Bacteroidaceae bacterium]
MTPKQLQQLQDHYKSLSERIEMVRQRVARPLTLAEKILFTHLFATEAPIGSLQRGESYADFRPDRVAMQDATAQMAVLQFMNAGRDTTAVPTSIHCDHLIQAHRGAEHDLPVANERHREVYDFLASAAGRYAMDFWAPGAG